MLKKRFGQFTILILVSALGVLAGCASTRDALGVAGKGDVAALQDEVAGLKARVETKADKAEVVAVAQKGEHLEKKLSTVTVDVGIHSQRIGKLDAELLKTNQAVANLGTSVQERFAALEKRVVGVRSEVSRTVARVGAAEDKAGIYNPDTLGWLHGFPTAQLDEKTKELKVCAEMSPAMKKLLDAETKKQASKKRAPTLVAGHADDRPFRDKDGKVLANSDELNAQCAELRAQAVAAYLKEITKADVKAAGRGTTTKFAGYDMNRTALIDWGSGTPTVAAAPAPAAPAPAPAPAKPDPQVGLPGPPPSLGPPATK